MIGCLVVGAIVGLALLAVVAVIVGRFLEEEDKHERRYRIEQDRI